MIISPEELTTLLNNAKEKGREREDIRRNGLEPPTVRVEVLVPPALVAELRQAIVTMRRIAGTPSIRRRALTDCQQLDYRASKLEDALKAAGG